MQKPKIPSRRGFLKKVATTPIIVLAEREGLFPRPGALAQKSQKGEVTKSPTGPPGEPFVGIQIGAVSFVDEGVEKVLDILEKRAAVNALMLAVFTYGRGIAGRQIPGQPLPDHGAQEYDTNTFHGGDYAAVHSEYYRESLLRDFRAPDVGDFDLLGAVAPKAKARKIKSYCWFEDVYNPRLLANFEKVAEIDVCGRRTGQACLTNPAVRNLLASLVEDWIKSYDIDGIMWGSERQGPFNNAVGAHHGGFGGHPSITCFCPYCLRKGRERGIDVERAREGFLALDRWVQAAWAEPRPSDGYFVALWRLLLDYPEILAWEKLWSDSQHEIYGLIYGIAKNLNSRLQVGWHIWHNNSFSPFFRAEQDYARLRPVSDFLKVVMYNQPGGPRMAEYVQNVHSTMFRDLSPEQVLDIHYRILGYENEAKLDQLRAVGLSTDYVARETKRALAGVQGKVQIYPGISIDIPTGASDRKTRPSDVRDSVRAAFTAGAQGVILSRKYSEMRLENLSGAGKAIRELRLKTQPHLHNE